MTVYFFDCSMNGEDVRLMLWDTAGQEEFDSLTSVYYRGLYICAWTANSQLILLTNTLRN